MDDKKLMGKASREAQAGSDGYEGNLHLEAVGLGRWAACFGHHLMFCWAPKTGFPVGVATVLIH